MKIGIRRSMKDMIFMKTTMWGQVSWVSWWLMERWPWVWTMWVKVVKIKRFLFRRRVSKVTGMHWRGCSASQR